MSVANHVAMQATAVSANLGSVEVLHSINLSLAKGRWTSIVGPNGAGKSTMLKILSKEQDPDTGQIAAAKKLKIGYYAQHQVDELNMQATPLQELRSIDGGLSEQDARDILGGFDFRGARVEEVINNFLGETSRAQHNINTSASPPLHSPASPPLYSLTLPPPSQCGKRSQDAGSSPAPPAKKRKLPADERSCPRCQSHYRAAEMPSNPLECAPRRHHFPAAAL